MQPRRKWNRRWRCISQKISLMLLCSCFWMRENINELLNLSWFSIFLLNFRWEKWRRSWRRILWWTSASSSSPQMRDLWPKVPRIWQTRLSVPSFKGVDIRHKRGAPDSFDFGHIVRHIPDVKPDYLEDKPTKEEWADIRNINLILCNVQWTYFVY